MKLSKLLSLHIILSKASLSKVSDVKDKLSIVKLNHESLKAQKDFDELVRSIQEKFQGPNHDKMIIAAQKYDKELKDGSVSETAGEVKKLNDYWLKYQNDVNAAINEELETEKDIDELSEEIINKLIESNPEWTVEDIDKLI